MRWLGVVLGVGFLAACGGEKTPGATGDSTATSRDTTTAPGPGGAGGGAAHDVNMVQEGASDYKFVPNDLNIKVGDRIVFHNVSGFPHNISFWPDSIPAGAQQVLEPQLPNPIGPLQSELLTEAGRTVTLSFAGAPTGVYKFYCTPHLAMGMRGTITVSP